MTRSIYLSFIYSILCFGIGCTKEYLPITEQVLIEDNKSLNKVSREAIMCKEISIGISWPLTVETTVFYCCTANWCIPGGSVPCWNCDIFLNNPMEARIEKEENKHFSINIHDLVPEIKTTDYIVISNSNKISIKEKKYSIETGKYFVDSSGYITLKLIISK